jgi:hypothetical protein
MILHNLLLMCEINSTGKTCEERDNKTDVMDNLTV